ncbi:MAG: HAMP domain-containing histidine kinase [Reyranella sp.]|nr:HAMP domain-containing histidine kinase [Reyranella sp.]
MSAAAFEQEAIDVNLRRIPWLLGATMILALWPIASFWSDREMAWLKTVLVFDLASAALFLALNIPARRQPRESGWRSAYVWLTVVLALAYMDGYYFLIARSFGQNPSYILGVIMTAAFFLLPPRRFLPLLLANHLIYCVVLARQPGIGAEFVAVLIQNSTGAVVAGLVAVLLFRAHREEYLQRQALAVANRFLVRRNEQLNDLMAITAHDLRAPLLGMRDLLGLARKASDDGRRGDILDRVATACADLVGLVSRLLRAHAAEEQAERGLTLVPRDVRDIVREAIERVSPRAGRRGLAFDVRLPDAPAVLRVDAMALGQVLDNLLFNAVKFSPDGGGIMVGLLHESGGWRCEVGDDGPGIPVEERASLFQKFHRGSARAAEDDEGSGLGLFIAATLMRAMGGDVEYRQRGAKGATFVLTFDVAGWDNRQDRKKA